MTDIQIDAGTLLFSDDDTLTATYMLVPFGEKCRSNLGEFEVGTGAFSVPEDFTGMAVNLDHAREQVVAGFTRAQEQAAGIIATFSFAKTKEGRAAFADAKSPTGKRRHVSAEVSNVVIKDGKATGGTLFGAALVEKPAFASATLLAAEDTGLDETPEQLIARLEAELSAAKGTTPTTVTTPVVTVTEPETPAAIKEDDVTVATVPNTLGTAAESAAVPAPLTVSEIGQMLYACAQGTLDLDDMKTRLGNENGSTLFATLSDVKYDGTGGLASTLGILPQWMGLIWQALNYRQQVLPLFAHKDLTSLTLNGWKWTTKPTGGDWAGNKAAVPSNTLVVAPVTGTASRYAIGHDIAREFVDFSVPGFFESYAEAVTEDYAKWADLQVSTAILAGSTALAGDALTTLPGATGGTIGSAASAIIDGASVLVTKGVLPDFALVATALWKQMVKMPKSNVIGYLNAALGLAEGDLGGFIIRPSASVTAGKVLVGAKEAATVYELPAAPIRIDALDLAKGGVDKAAFGYCGVVINDATGLQLVTAAVA